MNGNLSGKLSYDIQKRMRRYWQLYLLVLPAVAAVFIFHYVPIYGVQIAFKNYRPSRGVWGSDWVGFKHFIRFVTYGGFWSIIRNTVMINVYELMLFPLPIIFALMINEVRSPRYKKTVQMISYAPHFVSTVIVCSLLQLFCSYENGLINTILTSLGLERADILANERSFIPMYVLSGLWQNLGWNTIIYTAALSGISPEIIEAAKVDGAGRLRVIWHVMLPGIRTTVITMLILSTGSMLSVGFEKVFLMQNPMNLGVSRVVSTYVYELGIGGGQFSYASAIGLFNTVVNLVIVMAVNYASKKVTSIGLL